MFFYIYDYHAPNEKDGYKMNFISFLSHFPFSHNFLSQYIFTKRKATRNYLFIYLFGHLNQTRLGKKSQYAVKLRDANDKMMFQAV